MATKANIKCKVLSVSEKMEIIETVDAQPHVKCIKVAKQFSILVSTLNNIMANKKNILQ
jgi:hypothetical protein